MTDVRSRGTRPGRLPRILPVVVLGRARAELWPLVATLLVVALTTFLALVTPRVVDRASDAFLRAQLQEAGALADTTVGVPFPPSRLETGGPDPDSAADTVRVAQAIQLRLPPELAVRLQRPRVRVVTPPLPAPLPEETGRGEVTVQLVWLWNGGPLPVRWVAGAEPGSAPAVAPTTTGTGPPQQVPVGLSAAVAARLHVGVGDTVPATSDQRGVELVVSGVFAPEDPADPAWQAERGLVDPLTTVDRFNQPHTVTGALLSDQSLPAARLAVDERGLTRELVFPPVLDQLHTADVETIARAVTSVQARPQVLYGESATVRTGLATVLLQARERLRAVRAQSATLVTGVVGAAGLVLLLTAGLLAQRRRPVLALLRSRGASLPGIGGELLLESAAVAAVGAAAGLAAAAVLVPGSTPWPQLVAGPALALVTGPVMGVAAAARTGGGRRPPADREQRRARLRDSRLRRLAAEAALLLVAVGALAALRSRGVSADLLVAAAPGLALLAGGVLVVRLLPALLTTVRGRADRARHAVPLLAAVRSSENARSALPLLALTVTAGLCAFSLTLGATVDRGQVQASWDAVGGDVSAVVQPSSLLPERVPYVAGRPGVERVVTGRVEQAVPLLGVPGTERTTVLVVDPATFAGLLDSTPLPDVPDLGLLAPDGGPVQAGVHALVPAAARDVPAGRVSLVWDREQVPLLPVGTAPPLLSRLGATVVLDAGTLAAGAPGSAVADLALPNTLWAVGPGALAAVSDAPGLVTADVTDRREQLADLRTDPLGRDVTRLMTATAAAALLFALLALVVGTAGSAPDRVRTLAVLRTLGLTPTQARRVIAGELVPPVLLPALVGSALGVAVAALTTGALGLQQLTGSPDVPRPTVPWLVVAVPAALLALTLVLIGLEAARRQRDRLGDVLRIGG